MKTFEQCCDEVAKKYGFKNGLVDTHKISIGRFYEEAAELYADEVKKEFAREKVKEAIRLSRLNYDPNWSHTDGFTEQEILEKLGL